MPRRLWPRHKVWTLGGRLATVAPRMWDPRPFWDARPLWSRSVWTLTGARSLALGGMDPGGAPSPCGSYRIRIPPGGSARLMWPQEGGRALDPCGPQTPESLALGHWAPFHPRTLYVRGAQGAPSLGSLASFNLASLAAVRTGRLGA